MIIWLNGPFGAGKTTVANLLLEADPSLAVFDTEQIGYALSHALRTKLPVDDFQDWASWRRLVVAALAEISAELQTDIVVPQTVLVEKYWREIADGLAERDVDVRAVTLHVDAVEHQRRINDDGVEADAAGWRLNRRADYDDALAWLASATTVIDTTTLTPNLAAAVVRTIATGRS